MNEITGLILLVVAFLLNVLLAAAGSAVQNVQPSILKHLEEDGVSGAARAVRVSENATRFLFSLRVGKSLLRLIGIGITLMLFLPVLSGGSTLRLLTILIVMSTTWIVFGLSGYLAENYILRDPVQWATRLAPMMAVTEAVLYPLVWLSLRLEKWLSTSPDGTTYPMVTEEEIMTLVSAGEEGGIIEGDERAMIRSIFQLDDTMAREVMIPRIDILAFDENTSLLAATEKLLESGHSRAPVFTDSIDQILGLLFIKDLLAAWVEGIEGRVVSELVRKAYFVPEAKKVDELLEEMQARRIQMSIVVDEYGGTAGLVTFEDIVEEIVGEVRDEYDEAEEAAFRIISDGEYEFSGGIDLDDVNELAGVAVPKETSETLGGYIYSHLGRVPTLGERIEAGGLEMIVEEVDGRRIQKVRAFKIESVPDDTEVAADEPERPAAK